MSPQKSNPESSFRARLSLKKTLLCFGLLWILVLVSSLLYYTLGNAAGRSYWHIFNSSLFFVNIPVFCYALLSFVAERGLFNGLRYSLKQVRTFFFKHHRSQLMEEYAAATEEELKGKIPLPLALLGLNAAAAYGQRGYLPADGRVCFFLTHTLPLIPEVQF